MHRTCFLGNSHTFSNAYAYQVRHLVASVQGPAAIHVEAHAAGGCGLDWHRNQPASVHAVTLNTWDDLVLQHSAHPWPGESALAEAVAWWTATARPTAKRIWLAMVWPEMVRPQDAAMRAAVYRRVAAAENIRVLPIADAWMAVRRDHPDLNLYDADAEHASPAGSYLAACTAVMALHGIDPRGLPHRIEVRSHLLVDLDGATAARLQAAAFMVCA